MSELISLSANETTESSDGGVGARSSFPLNPARVAWLMPNLEGGPYMQPLFREFTKLFPKTVIFTGGWSGFVPGYERTFRVRYLPGYRFFRINELGQGVQWAPVRVVWELLRLCPDVVLVVGFDIWTLTSLVLKAFARCPVVFLWDGISRSIAYLDSPLRLKCRRLMARFFDSCISNSKEGAEYLRDALGIPDAKLDHHPFLVADAGLWQPASASRGLKFSLAHPRFLYVGRLVTEKGVERLLVACRILKERGVREFSLVIAGAGAQGDHLHRLAHDLELDAIVEWAGAVPYEELGSYYKECDVLVFPSLEDVWGMVVLEAMALGKPVLCSQYAGAREMVLEGDNGFIFDPNQPEKLAAAMERLIREPQLIEKLGKRSREIVAVHTPQRAARAIAFAVLQVLESAK